MTILGLHILTVLAFAKLAAFQPSLKTFTVFFLTVRFFTIAPFGMLVVLNFWLEPFIVPLHQVQNRSVPFILVLLRIMTSHAVTPVTCLVYPKTVAIELQTLGPFTIASHLFISLVLSDRTQTHIFIFCLGNSSRGRRESFL